MAGKMWAGRFTKEVDERVNDFNSSISFDHRMYKQDIEGSSPFAPTWKVSIYWPFFFFWSFVRPYAGQEAVFKLIKMPKNCLCQFFGLFFSKKTAVYIAKHQTQH